MFDRFTDRARKVMGLARGEAARNGDQYIGTEHILLGLLEEGSGVAANALRNLNLNHVMLSTAIEGIRGEGPTMVIQGQLPFTPRCKRLLELASESAQKLKHSYIGTEHLLIGITRDVDSIATKALTLRNVSPLRLRNEVLEMLGAETEPAGSNKEEVHLAEGVKTATLAIDAPSSFDHYQEFTKSVAIYPGAGTGGFDAMTYVALKGAGECGEFAEKLGKQMRKQGTIGALTRDAMNDEFKLALAKELGDRLWYISQAASELGYSLSDIARINVEKLTSRKARGVLDGSGDDR